MWWVGNSHLVDLHRQSEVLSESRHMKERTDIRYILLAVHAFVLTSRHTTNLYCISCNICPPLLKEPGPIASDFSQTFGDFGIRRKLIFFSLPLVNFTAEKCTVWKILMKMCLVMVTIIQLTHKVLGHCKVRNLLLCPNGLTDLNVIWNQDILGDNASFE